jgi:hypothetical protein
MVFSVLAMSAYLSAVIRNHLLRIRKNLGNFLAFGVKNSTLTGLYISVSMMILVAAMIPALMLALATGTLFEKHILGRLIMVDPAQDYFTLMNSWLLMFVGGLFIVAIIRTFFSVRRILKCTPGDLIYERD